MKKLAFVSLAVSSLLLPSMAAQAAPSQLRVKGGGADASFLVLDPANCTATGAFVGAFEIEQRSGGSSETSGLVFVDLYVSNTCDFTTILFAQAVVDVAPGELEVQGNGQSARLQKSVVLQDSTSGASIPLTIDLTWDAIGQPTRSSFRQILSSPTERVSTHSTRIERNAQATGSLTTSTINLDAQTSTTFATVSRSNDGTLTHY